MSIRCSLRVLCHNLSQSVKTHHHLQIAGDQNSSSVHERDDNCILTIFSAHFSIQPNHFSHSEDESSTFVQKVDTLPLHGAQTQNKTTISITLFSVFFVFVNRLYFQLFQNFFIPFVVKVCTGGYSDKFQFINFSKGSNFAST